MAKQKRGRRSFAFDTPPRIAAWASVADLAIMQMQDLLGLGSEARINTPSTLGTNWKWRALPGAYDHELACRVRREMELYQRLPEQP